MGKASVQTSDPRSASGRSSDTCNRFASDAPHTRIRSRASESRPATCDRSYASDRVQLSAARSPSRLRPRCQAHRAPSLTMPRSSPAAPCSSPRRGAIPAMPRSSTALCLSCAPSPVLTSHLLYNIRPTVATYAVHYGVYLYSHCNI
jgi:hypothetical protein